METKGGVVMEQSKKTRNVLNVEKFHKTIENYISVEHPIEHIMISDLGQKQFASLNNYILRATDVLSKSDSGDVFGILLEETNGGYMYVITGPDKNIKVQAPKDLRRLFVNFGTFPISSLKTVDVSGFDTSKTVYFDSCFANFGNASGSKEVQVIGLNTWNTWQAESMRNMFYSFKQESDEVFLDLSNFDVRGVKNFAGMFKNFGRNAQFIEFKGVEQWEPASAYSSSGIIDFGCMFDCCGEKADYFLDLSEWKINQRLKRDFLYKFNWKVALKVKAPTWKLKN